MLTRLTCNLANTSVTHFGSVAKLAHTKRRQLLLDSLLPQDCFVALIRALS